MSYASLVATMKTIRCLFIGTVVAATVGFFNTNSSRAQTWQNETGSPLEADYANLQWPFSISIPAGATTPAIYGRIYEAGVTESTGPSAMVTAQVGYGPAGTDPRTSLGWLWSGAVFNVEYGNDDEYQGALTVSTSGSYSYTFRYSLDGGASYTLGDLDGAGSNSGLDFSTTQMGALTVVPEPSVAALWLWCAGAAALVRKNWRARKG